MGRPRIRTPEEVRTAKNAYKRKYYHENREKYLEYCTEYREENKDKRSKLYQDNKESHLKKCKLYQETNKEQIKLYKHQWYVDNKVEFLEKVKKYHSTDKGYAAKRKHWTLYRARKKGLVYDLTEDQWISILNIFDNSCAYCGDDCKLSQDHVVPVSKGGGYTFSNIVPACKSCNSRKSSNQLEMWYPGFEKFSQNRYDLILSHIGGGNND